MNQVNTEIARMLQRPCKTPHWAHGGISAYAFDEQFMKNNGKFYLTRATLSDTFFFSFFLFRISSSFPYWSSTL